MDKVIASYTKRLSDSGTSNLDRLISSSCCKSFEFADKKILESGGIKEIDYDAFTLNDAESSVLTNFKTDKYPEKGVTIISKKFQLEPKEEQIELEAFSEETAIASASSSSGELKIVGIELIKKGKQGILGVGKKPNVYKIKVIKKGKVHFSISTNLVADVRYIYKIFNLKCIPEFHRGDILDIKGYISDSIAELEKFEDFAPFILYHYIRQAKYSYSKYISVLLRIAKEIKMSNLLYEEISDINNIPIVDDWAKTRYVPELVSDQQIGWSDATYANIKSHVKELLSKKPVITRFDELNLRIYFACDICEINEASFAAPNGGFICGECRENKSNK
jgi:hypothetical protein